MARTVFTTKEKTTPVYSFALVDEDDAAIADSSILTLTLTYYNVADNSIINSRSAQDVLDDNDVDLSATGVVTWNMTVDDTIIVDTTETEVGDTERHRALWTWTYTAVGGITRTGRDEIDILVENLGLVT